MAGVGKKLIKRHYKGHSRKGPEQAPFAAKGACRSGTRHDLGHVRNLVSVAARAGAMRKRNWELTISKYITLIEYSLVREIIFML